MFRKRKRTVSFDNNTLKSVNLHFSRTKKVRNLLSMKVLHSSWEKMRRKTVKNNKMITYSTITFTRNLSCDFPNIFFSQKKNSGDIFKLYTEGWRTTSCKLLSQMFSGGACLLNCRQIIFWPSATSQKVEDDLGSDTGSMEERKNLLHITFFSLPSASP